VVGLLAIRVEVEFHWGYSVKRPIFSASQPALFVPPPTSLVGALAGAAGYMKGWPEVFQRELPARQGRRRSPTSEFYSSTAKILEEVVWASLALTDSRFIGPLIGIAETRDIIRSLIAPYQRRVHVYPGSKTLFGVQPHGKIYAPSMHAHVIYLAKSEEAVSWARAIGRIGNKESIVSMVSTEVGEAKVLEGISNVETCYYFPAELGDVMERSGFIREVLSIPREAHYGLAAVQDIESVWREFIVPLKRIRVKLGDNAIAVKDPSEELVVVPREVMSYCQHNS